MKKLLLVIGLMLMANAYSQNQLSFSYDNAGNQVVRELICINCKGGKTVKSGGEVTSADFVQSELNPAITYYPNPVQEELYIKWNNTEDRIANKILVYNISGQIINQKEVTDTSYTSILFSNNASGIYNVHVIYNDGTADILKVIKK